MMKCPQCGKTYDSEYEACPDDNMVLIDEAAARLDPMLGTKLAGRYMLVQKIGQGGMGAIYKAVHTRMDRICAVKLLTALSGDNEAAHARFNREARMASRIDNPHAITIYDYGESEDGIPFLAMEFIDGKPLSDILAVEKTFPTDRVVRITSQIAEALAAAHAMGIVHRDLKPDNIMLTQKGAETDYVKVLDFGIAKTMAEERQDNLTKTGYVLGTPAYMSPEQLSGEKLDPRSDIYSLAIIVYEMLSTKLPFEGDNQQAVLIKRITGDPIPLRVAAPSVSDAIERVVMDALTRDRDRRHMTVEAFARALVLAEQSGTQEMSSRSTNYMQQGGPGQDTIAWASNHPDSQSRQPSSYASAEDDQAKTIAIGRPNVSGDVNDPRKTVPYQAADKAQVFNKGEAKPGIAPSPQPPVPPHQPTVQLASDRVSSAESKIMASKKAVESSAADSKVIASEKTGPRWVWYGVAAAVAVVAVLIFLFLPTGGSGFALVVTGAPPGSEVFVNNDRRGATAADGTIRIEGLDAGNATVRVTHKDFAEFESVVSGNKGEERTLEARLLPFEIDIKGAMVLIPAGEFVMGSNDPGHGADEKPEHVENLPDFYIDKYEVTNAQYKAFCDATGRKPPANPSFDPTYFESKPDFPVLGVTRDEAREYAKWAGKRLPTEVEWEKAAGWDPSSKAKRQWPWGNSGDISQANLGSGRPASVTAHTTDRSAYGVYGMAGNAYEWVDSYYDAYPGNATPNRDFGTKLSVVRGGNFLLQKAEEARTTYRNNLPAIFSGTLTTPVGFRCAMSAEAYRKSGR